MALIFGQDESKRKKAALQFTTAQVAQLRQDLANLAQETPGRRPCATEMSLRMLAHACAEAFRACGE